MPPLVSRTAAHREHLLLRDEHLLSLDSESLGRDRVRRVLFDHVETMLVWKETPWTRILVSGVLMLLSLLFMLTEDPVVMIIAGVVLVGSVTAMIYFTSCRITVIRFIREGMWREFRILAPAHRINPFLRRMRANIERTQERLREQAAAAEPEQPVETEPQTGTEQWLAPDQPIAPAAEEPQESTPGEDPQIDRSSETAAPYPSPRPEI